ncbi:MAG: hypothetical protein COY40_05535 [Alphaproteobacteria bacterium CG_4_10_14_0_8_um_filter_53_9]|nr:MAG: hypothetical protein COY40_05535 [Alphaproteobacteria bacterium CG_4_10_14_0_8_um_filter_53_9]
MGTNPYINNKGKISDPEKWLRHELKTKIIIRLPKGTYAFAFQQNRLSSFPPPVQEYTSEEAQRVIQELSPQATESHWTPPKNFMLSEAGKKEYSFSPAGFKAVALTWEDDDNAQD